MKKTLTIISISILINTICFILDFNVTFAEKIIGTDNNDVLEGTTSIDILIGLKGDDILYGYEGDDIFEGNEGNDEIVGCEGNDKIFAGSGNDLLYGGLGNDKLFGGKGSDKIYGDNGNDQIYGADDDDTIFGETGNDLIFGGNGDDVINGGLGNDTLYGLQGINTLNGGEGNDTIYGGVNDICNGGFGDDECYYQCEKKISCETIIDELPESSNNLLNFINFIEDFSTTTYLFQGYLENSHEKPVDKTLKIKFVIFNNKEDAKWLYERYITIKNGMFDVVLGKTVKLEKSFFDGKHYISVYVKEDKDYREIKELKSILSKNKLIKSMSSEKTEIIKKHTIFDRRELVDKTTSISSTQEDNKETSVTSFINKWNLNNENITKSSDLSMIILNSDTSILLHEGVTINNIAIKEKELIENDKEYGIVVSRVNEVEVDIEYNPENFQKHHNTDQYLSEISKTSWEMTNNICFARVRSKGGWMDVCAKMYYLEGDSKDFYSLELFSTAKSTNYCTLREITIEAKKRPGTPFMRWVDYSPRQDLTSSTCGGSVSLGVTVFGASLGASFNLCDKCDITKFSIGGHFKNAWKGPWYGYWNIHAEREIAFLQTVSVKPDEIPFWNFRYSFISAL